MVNPKALQETLITTDFLYIVDLGRNKQTLATPSGCRANAGYSIDRALSEQAVTCSLYGMNDRMKRVVKLQGSHIGK